MFSVILFMLRQSRSPLTLCIFFPLTLWRFLSSQLFCVHYKVYAQRKLGRATRVARSGRGADCLSGLRCAVLTPPHRNTLRAEIHSLPWLSWRQNYTRYVPLAILHLWNLHFELWSACPPNRRFCTMLGFIADCSTSIISIHKWECTYVCPEKLTHF
jgi:hypothetical protein